MPQVAAPTLPTPALRATSPSRGEGLKSSLARKRGAIHAECKRIGIDEETRREMLQNIAGVRSTRDLSERGANAVLDHLHRSSPGGRIGRTPNNLGNKAMLQKIEALLADMGLPWGYAKAIARRQSPEIKKIEWLPEAALIALISALARAQQKRARAAFQSLQARAQERGLTAESFAAWATEAVTRPGIHTAQNPPFETIQTLNRLLALIA
ncbi:MAG: regulatory protein GemA [Betaproteobacteria bacterium]|nr:regulatory protein GemA [Betaproteobacteria bacterium]